MWISTCFSTCISLPYIDQIHRPDPGEFSCPCFVRWESSCEEARDSPTKTQVYKSYLSLFYCYIWHFIATYDIFILLQLSNFLYIYHFIIFNALFCFKFWHCFHFIFHLWIFNTELWLLWASTFFIWRCVASRPCSERHLIITKL